MQQYLVVIFIAAAVIVANGDVQDLRVNVLSVQPRFGAVQNVKVILKYSNTGDDMMSIYKYALPEKGLIDPLFELTRDGKPVEYVGPMVKRRMPTAEDLISLEPGMTVSAVIQLSTVYNMTESGNYIIQYKMNADQVLFSMDNMMKHRTMASNDGQESIVQSAPIVVFAVGRENLLIRQAIAASTQPRALTPTYISCTTSQSNSVNTAMSWAESYNNDALQHLSGMSVATTRYTTWFGTYSSNNMLTVRSHFTKMQSALSTQTLSFDCSCPAADSSTYAYVYPSQHYRIYLCGAYWPSSMTGTDSKGGTILHELAHFTVMAGTDDFAYGQSACQNLARTAPTRAIRNSDSLQYFAENNPRLN